MDHLNDKGRFHRKAISVTEAQKRIEPYIQIGGIEEIDLEEAFERRLATDITANHSMPHFRRSGMDGFAIKSEVTADASSEHPVLLKVIESVPCGSVPIKEVKTHTASRIMTGAMVPEGADAVVMLEMTGSREIDGKTFVSISREIKKDLNVSPVGLELSKGDFLMERGRRIRAGETALLAAFGYAKVKVFKQPRVAILSTGSELLNIDESLQLGKIRNSNAYMLAAQVRDAGGIPILIGFISDDINQAKKRIYDAFSLADFVITTGGVSVGDYDILTDLFADWEGQMIFNKIMMRPGSPTTVGVWNNKLLFALSGNPGACFVGFELLVRPVIFGMKGKSNLYLPQIKAYLSQDYPKVNAYERYVRGKTYVENGKVCVKQAGIDQSSIMLSIKDSDSLIIIPPGGNGLKAGEMVSVLKLDGME